MASELDKTASPEGYCKLAVDKIFNKAKVTEKVEDKLCGHLMFAKPICEKLVAEPVNKVIDESTTLIVKICADTLRMVLPDSFLNRGEKITDDLIYQTANVLRNSFSPVASGICDKLNGILPGQIGKVCQVSKVREIVRDIKHDLDINYGYSGNFESSFSYTDF